MNFFKKSLLGIYKRFFYKNRIDELIKRGLVVGKDFNMLDGVIIDQSHTWHIQIGDSVTLAPRDHILAHDASTKMHLNYTRIGKVKIGNRVFVGAGSIILPGVTIGDNVIIGAGSLVSRDIPSGCVVAGNPAKILCSLDKFLEKRRHELTIYPNFGDEYTLNKNISNELKNEMNAKMINKIGYVI